MKPKMHIAMSTTPPTVDDQVTEERLVAAIELMSEVILKHGVKYAPLLDRLERELTEIKRHDDVISRARRHLERARGAPRSDGSPSPLALRSEAPGHQGHPERKDHD